MSLRCLNDGGEGSRLLLDSVPRAEERIAVGASLRAALEIWQARPGEIFTALDPEGTAWRVRYGLADAGPFLVPFEQLPQSPESPLRIDLYQALPERERFELVLEKATELGVGRIVPFESCRSITLEQRDARQKKSHRWPHVLLRAARQCRRAELPCLTAVTGWDQVLYQAHQADLALLLYEKECGWRLGEILRDERPRRVALIIGPEGGFTPEEVEEARQLGIVPVSLGPRLLRTETAAMAAIAAVQARLGDLG
ncbi:16S rRNA (uracil1498-N3)-methyltransferase [Geothermobacter ehrlichii]|uniref:Ribosomal RNA small subunit methyltransferase E n=1 Tax=Geothermobacter ehrlichii TaxID=213224 RepID=A0A5D3WNN3_9BACT|nr:16S rRNA (uracil(1498)-N(3))-methyltransferase [Geothermobacter ehrlichii]TYO99708.1 16S rRNA (uracil1498-N3)-methyltransferase [Geothermobacter ehrlichii]